MKPVAALLYVNRLVVDGAHISRAAFFPMKDLSAIERLLQVKIRRQNVHGGSSAPSLDVEQLTQSPTANIARRSARSTLRA
jgi:hypothetical protein